MAATSGYNVAMKLIRILIADDHLVIREGLATMLAGHADFEVVGQAADGAQAVQLAAELQPHVVLMDLRMPGMDGVAAISALKAQGLPCQVLVLSSFGSEGDVLQAIRAGAVGYILKDIRREELFEAIRIAAAGGSVFAPAVAGRMKERLLDPTAGQLSLREIEVLQLVSQGRSNQEISQLLHLSLATVKTHLLHINDKLGVNDRTAAVIVAIQRGILNLPPPDLLHQPTG